MSIIQEAAETKDQLELRLQATEEAYNSRKEEMEDDSFWSQLSRGAKMSYVNKLKSLEDDITRITRRLARAIEVAPEAPVAETVTETPEPAPEVKGDFDIEKEIIASPIEVMDGDGRTSFGSPANITSSPEEVQTNLANGSILKNEIDVLISSTEELIKNNLSGGVEPIAFRLQEILTKFKEIRGMVETTTALPAEDTIKLLVIQGDAPVTSPVEAESNSDSDVIAVPTPTNDKRELLKGAAEEKIKFTDREVEDVLNNNWYVYDDQPGEYVLEVNNPFDSPNSYNRYKIVVRYAEPGHFSVYPKDTYDKDSKRLCKQIGEEILYKLKLNK